MVKIGTVFSPIGKKALLCGSGELGKEIAIELQRYGVEVVALDRYRDAPAMQVAHRSYEVSMLDGKRLREIIEAEKPDYIIPEIEAIATDTLLELEAEGYHVVPTAKAAKLTMNREGIRRLAAEELGLPTSPYRFASTRAEFTEAVREVGIPCVVKPVMSSSGHGQSVIRTEEDVERAWYVSQHEGRTGSGRVIVEGFIPFDYEITQLTVRHAGGTSFLEPIGHYQEDGDYREYGYGDDDFPGPVAICPACPGNSRIAYSQRRFSRPVGFTGHCSGRGYGPCRICQPRKCALRTRYADAHFR